jgi:hypothetical protein
LAFEEAQVNMCSHWVLLKASKGAVSHPLAAHVHFWQLMVAWIVYKADFEVGCTCCLWLVFCRFTHAHTCAAKLKGRHCAFMH